MSLPQFPTTDTSLTREDAINQILSSIAMEELGLSHIINAEGEKIQYAIGTIEGVSGPSVPPTIQELLEINKSVRETLDTAFQSQIFLKSKMNTALKASVLSGPTGATGAFIYAQPCQKKLRCVSYSTGKSRPWGSAPNPAGDSSPDPIITGFGCCIVTRA